MESIPSGIHLRGVTEVESLGKVPETANTFYLPLDTLTELHWPDSTNTKINSIIDYLPPSHIPTITLSSLYNESTLGQEQLDELSLTLAKYPFRHNLRIYKNIIANSDLSHLYSMGNLVRLELSSFLVFDEE